MTYTEIEVKMYVPDLDALVQRLGNAGAELIKPRVHEINIRFENNVMASIVISGNCPAPGGTFMTFIFDNGRIDIDGWGGGWSRAYEGNKQLDPSPVTPEMSAGRSDHNFIDAILGRAEPRTSAQNAGPWFISARWATSCAAT